MTFFKHKYEPMEFIIGVILVATLLIVCGITREVANQVGLWPLLKTFGMGLIGFIIIDRIV